MKLIPNEHRNKLKKIADPSPSVSKCELNIEPPLVETKQTDSLLKDTQELYQRKKKKPKITNFPE